MRGEAWNVWFSEIVQKAAQGFHAELLWFSLSIVASYLIIPRAIEMRQKRALRGARAIVLNRSNKLHQAVAEYAATLIAFGHNLDHPACRIERDRVTNRLRHFRCAAGELSPVLRGKLGASYYAYRLDITALLGMLADNYGDYKGREIQTVMLYDPPENKRFDESQVADVDRLFQRLRKHCGHDLHSSPYTWGKISRCWSEAQIRDIQAALKPTGATPEECARKQISWASSVGSRGV